jgi:ribosomal-protein-alanine N-acetyltransferase
LSGKAPVVVRDLLAADLDEAWALDQRCFEAGIAYSHAEIWSFFARPGSVALAAERDGRFEGFAIAERRGVRGHVITIDVAETARRRGVGRRLFSALFARLEDAGAREIRLEVDVRNAGAIRFYESLGFDRTRVLRGYYGKGLDAYEMVKRS